MSIKSGHVAPHLILVTCYFSSHRALCQGINYDCHTDPRKTGRNWPAHLICVPPSKRKNPTWKHKLIQNNLFWFPLIILAASSEYLHGSCHIILFFMLQDANIFWSREDCLVNSCECLEWFCGFVPVLSSIKPMTQIGCESKQLRFIHLSAPPLNSFACSSLSFVPGWHKCSFCVSVQASKCAQMVREWSQRVKQNKSILPYCRILKRTLKTYALCNFKAWSRIIFLFCSSCAFERLHCGRGKFSPEFVRISGSVGPRKCVFSLCRCVYRRVDYSQLMFQYQHFIIININTWKSNNEEIK